MKAKNNKSTWSENEEHQELEDHQKQKTKNDSKKQEE